jgi:ABC-2 type transport system permease protein
MNLTYMWAVYARELMRFRKLWMDTLFTPIVSMGLYLAVFGVVSSGQQVGGIEYLAFVYTGLLTMTMVNSSFSNPAFALVIARNMGTLIDLQMAPIAPWRIGLAYSMAALTRGLITLAVGITATVWFVPLRSIAHPLLLLLSLVSTGLLFGFLGVIFGMRAKNFEALTFVTSFVLQPMIFLAGVFYPIAQLPGIWATISQFNPMHHVVNLVRFSATGYSDASPMLSFGIVIGATLIAGVAMHFVTQKSLKA